MISSEQCISREMYHATDNGIKINRDSRIIDPTISVDFYPVPSCYPPSSLCVPVGCNPFQYVLIPEYHKRKKGEDRPALHMHGLCNLGAVQIERALSENGRGLTDDEGRPIYNVLDWKWGFSTCVPLDGEYERAVNYVAKYITKAEDKIFGKWYFSSRGLKKKPDIIPLESIPYDEFRDAEKLQTHQQFESEIYSGVKIISEKNPPLAPIKSTK